MRIVIALGGNALLQRGQPMTAENQRTNIRLAAERIAAVTPGNLRMATAPRWGCWRYRAPPTRPSTPIRSMYSVQRPRR